MSSCVDVHLPPGFRFHPTDDELVMHYLCRKSAAMPVPINIIADVDLYKYDPWKLPELALYGEKEWYFFSPRDRKYPNGCRPNRAAGSGYWKATGADKPIGGSRAVAIKKALVFYAGKAPKGDKTNWIMHEYRLADTDRSSSASRNKHSLRLDDWVLCRIYNKKGSAEKKTTKQAGSRHARPVPDVKPVVVPSHVDTVHFDPSDSMPRESSCSEHVPSPPGFACDREVQSQPRVWNEWEKALQVPISYGNGTGMFTDFGSGSIEPGFRDPIQDILMFLQKPF